MTDLRWKKLADVLVQYSVGVKPGEKVLITMMEIDTFPLARACYQAVVEAGGLPTIEFQSVYLERDLMKLGNQEQVAWVNEMQIRGMDWADCYIGLRGARNPSEFSDIPVDVLASHKASMGTVSARRNNTRWVLTRVPNEAFAQQAGIPLDEMMEFYFNACLQDWEKAVAVMERVRERFQRGTRVRIVGKDTDLTFSTDGRLYCIGMGHANMPDGEVFTSPLEDTVNGYVYFDYPAIYGGRKIEGVRLRFDEGKLVEASSDTEQELLRAVLSSDAGASKLGEFGIGMNDAITHYSSDILYDEKIGGTIHLAMGRGYAKCKGTNSSSLHWDIVKRMRSGGKIYVDGELVMENGRLLEG